MVYKFFNERSKGSGVNNKGNLLVNSQLAEELQKPLTITLKEEKCILVIKIIFGVYV